MTKEKIHRGYNLEQIFWWVQRLGDNVVMREDVGRYRLVFSNPRCGTQEFLGSVWCVAKNALDALMPSINRATKADLAAFRAEFRESESV